MSEAPFEPVLALEGVVVEAPSGRGVARILDGVSFCVEREEILGVVGETGSGKSLTLLSIMGLVPPPGRITGGTIRYAGRELTALDADTYRQLRGREIGMVVQNAKSALNPLERISTQMRNVYAAHLPLPHTEIDAHAKRMLANVGFRDVERVFQAYPHQLSGGMAQRVLIAMALGPSPPLILVDEPTSGLDPTVAVHVMMTLQRSIRGARAAGIIVTHDLGVVARFCDRVVVLSAGRIVDGAPVASFFAESRGAHRATLIEAHGWADLAAQGDFPAEQSRGRHDDRR